MGGMAGSPPHCVTGTKTYLTNLEALLSGKSNFLMHPSFRAPSLGPQPGHRRRGERPTNRHRRLHGGRGQDCEDHMLRGSQTNQVRTELGKIDKNWLLFLFFFPTMDERRSFHNG